MPSSFQKQYPWTSSPLIANAAMGGFAGPGLATAVSRAGGIGFIGAVNDMVKLDQQLNSTKSLLKDNNIKAANPSTLPIGVGFLLFVVSLEEAIAVISRHLPAIVWLACPAQEGDLEIWSNAVRKAAPASKIWIQIASVSVALRVASACSPDVLIMQGSDAGGHGPFPGAGIVSLVPETRDALDREGFSEIGIFAAGGLGDGRGVAAALACGADGVVMGTGFLASSEVDMPTEAFRDAVLKTNDGGVSTARSTMFDELAGRSIWPSQYDGRAIAGASYKDFNSGTSLAEVQSRYTNASKEAHKGYGGEVRGAVWAGTGIGLVKELKTAGEIVKECRDSARLCLDRAIKSL
ncbi:inosine monophosphate dehydrogenase [Stipitochalara longipes BDJ]|nr:inosine monophosphate dehydrogenase [Stipitochalara longipes BDJ]